MNRRLVNASYGKKKQKGKNKKKGRTIEIVHPFLLSNRAITTALCGFVHRSRHFFIIALRPFVCVLQPSIPSSNCSFNVVPRVVTLLNKKEHFLRFLYAKSVFKCVSLLNIQLLEVQVDFFYAYRCYLHGSNRLSTFSKSVSTAFHLNNCFHNWLPIEITVRRVILILCCLG